MASTGAKVPAWKRLGLQLKPVGAAAGATAITPAPTPAPSSTNFGNDSAQSYVRGSGFERVASTPTLGKRKFPAEASQGSGHTAKFARRDDGLTPRAADGRPARTVSFSSNTKDASPRTPAPKTPKTIREGQALPLTGKPQAAKAAKPKKKAPPRLPPNLDGAIKYLRQWRDSRESWKFNKNQTTLMIKYAFEENGVLPASDIDTFYQYIRGLKGFGRVRLRESAKEVRDKDDAAKAAGFAEGVKNPEGKQEKYEGIIAKFTASSSPTERYSEEKFLAEKVDKFIAKRVVGRMRAEMVLKELADSEDGSVSGAVEKTEPAAADDGRRAARPRKSRTAVVEESSDESSSEDDDDDTSSSGSSDDSDEEGVGKGNDDDSTSSSGSSSEEEDEDEGTHSEDDN